MDPAPTNCQLSPIKSILSSLYFLTSFFGHKNCFHLKWFSFGLCLWIINILIHFSMDFYEAYAIFGVAWATVIGMFLITFIMASSCLAKTILPWLENTLIVLYETGAYPETLRIMKTVLKVAPVIVIGLGCAGGAGQYTCYHMDGATRLDFNNTLPHWLVVILNILRFVSLLHAFCGYSLFLVVTVCVMVVTQQSMKEFKGFMDKEFKKAQSTMTFGTAVVLFEERVSFVRQSSRSCMMMLMTLVVSSTLSFALNVYNFLFVKRFAIYFWFAILPLLWIAIPLGVAAWITDTYQTFAGVVLENWAQSSGDVSQTSEQGVVTRSGVITPEVTCITCRSSARLRGAHCTDSQYAKRKFRKSSRNVIRPLQIKSYPKESNTDFAFYIGARNVQNSFKLPRNNQKFSSGDTLEPTVEQQETGQRPLERAMGEGIGLESGVGRRPIGQRAVDEALVTSCDYSQSIPVRFDFERYIIYLQCLLPDVGFSIAGCLITWDKVYGLAVFMISLAAVFIQEVIFGSRKNTIAARP